MDLLLVGGGLCTRLYFDADLALLGVSGCIRYSVLYLPGLSRDFDCFDVIVEWDGM